MSRFSSAFAMARDLPGHMFSATKKTSCETHRSQLADIHSPSFTQVKIIQCQDATSFVSDRYSV